jgi:hypothetical protein
MEILTDFLKQQRAVSPNALLANTRAFLCTSTSDDFESDLVAIWSARRTPNASLANTRASVVHAVLAPLTRS